LVTAIMAMVRLIRLPDESATAGARAVAALVAVLPPALVGLVFTVLGLRRLRQLGPRPAESSPALLGGGLADPAADAPALMLAYPITF
jgi:hypothetical protein